MPDMERRDFLFRVSAGAAALGISPWLLAACGGNGGPSEGVTPRTDLAALTDRIAVARDPDARAATLAALDALGGAKAFARPGKRVVLKPNMAWAKAPHLAANTNPEVMTALTRAFLDAGAGEVLVFDRTCNKASLAYDLSGVAKACEEAGARVIEVPDRDSRFKTVTFGGGDVLAPDRRFPDGTWPIFADALDADLLVNVPVAKQHKIAGVTLGLKNMMGVMGGGRGKVHTYIHEAVALLNTKVRAHLTVLDATRILVANGPTGGDPADVVAANTVVAGVDPVAVDAWAATKLPWRKPLSANTLSFLDWARKLGVGEPDLAKKTILSV